MLIPPVPAESCAGARTPVPLSVETMSILFAYIPPNTVESIPYLILLPPLSCARCLPVAKITSLRPAITRTRSPCTAPSKITLRAIKSNCDTPRASAPLRPIVSVPWLTSIWSNAPLMNTGRPVVKAA